MTNAALLTRRPIDPLVFHGCVEALTIESECLAGNALGDPSARDLTVYVPPDVAPGERLPVVFLLAGFTGRGQSYARTDPWNPGVLVAHHAAAREGSAARAVLVLPDCFTRLGGSQYVDSDAVGAYATHVARELVALVDEHLPADPTRRAVAGISSGGFGALHLAMHHPGVFRAAATISGDCGFENLFPSEFLACLRGLLAYDGDPRRFLDAFLAKPDLSGDGHAIVNVLAMAACYSPNAATPLGFDLPFDLETGELKRDVWERWLAFDPLRAVERHVDTLRELALLHVECGRNDEYHLQWGSRRLARKLAELGVPHTHEEHDGGHRGIHHRYLEVVPRLVAALA